MNYLLSEAAEPIEQALERLLEKTETLHPFVVIEKVGNPNTFVQFSGSKERPLYFDVPAFRISLEEVTPERGAERAIEELTALGVQPDQRVIVREEEDSSTGGWGEPIRRPLPAG